jgi:protein-S-isoprenylcysteine O-methyltransferase Ste14
MSLSELAQRYRVTAGFLVGLAFLYVSEPTPLLFLAGTCVSLLGIGIRFWAAGYLEKAQKLTTSGPYSYTRNPLYAGSFLMLVGFTLAGGNWLAGVVVLVLFVAFYVPTVHREEMELRNGFPEAFDRYAAQVPRFLPRLTPYHAEAGVFRFEQLVRNREYNSLIGCAVGYLMIYIKLRMLS